MSAGGRRFVDSVAMRTRLLVAFGSLVVALAAFEAWYFPARQVQQAEDALLLRARTTTRLVIHDIGAAFDFADAKGVEQVFDGARSDPDLIFLVLYAANGTRFAALNGDRAPAAAPPELTDERRQVVADELIVSTPVLTTGKTKGTVVAGFSMTPLAAASRRIRLAARPRPTSPRRCANCCAHGSCCRRNRSAFGAQSFLMVRHPAGPLAG